VPINAVTDPYALEGRIATMAATGVIERGRVYIRGGVIADVRESGQPPPDGFARASVVKVGGTLIPGLIELHNHLSHNAIPLWDVPKRYAHSGSWQGTGACNAAVTKTVQVLANEMLAVDVEPVRSPPGPHWRYLLDSLEYLQSRIEREPTEEIGKWQLCATSS
jgi:hypothetical protein